MTPFFIIPEGDTIIHKKISEALMSLGMIRDFLFFYILHNIGYFTFQDFTQLVDGMGGHILSMLHGVICGTGKAQLHQPIR